MPKMLLIFKFYGNDQAGGMMAMLKGLKIPMSGTHHVGLDDAQNIARVLQRILIDGAVVKITGRRSRENPSVVKFTFRSRIK
jgi:inhibitor of KinA sporulation pathway (predicted exonuclease)